MKTVYYIFILLFFSTISFGQQKKDSLYIGTGNHGYTAFVSIVENGAKVEIIQASKSGVMHKIHDEFLKKDNNNRYTFQNDQIVIDVFISKIEFDAKLKKEFKRLSVTLDHFQDNVQILEAERNKAYYFDKTDETIKELDSILGKGNYFETDYYDNLESFRSDEKDMVMTHINYKESFDKLSNSIKIKILHDNRELIEKLKIEKNSLNFTEAQIGDFLLNSKMDKLIEYDFLLSILDKSPQNFYNWLDQSTFWKNKDNYLNKAVKDIIRLKTNAEFSTRLIHLTRKNKFENKSYKEFHKLIKKQKRKRFLAKSLPIVGYGIAFALAITLI